MNVYFEESYWECLTEKDQRGPMETFRPGTVFLWEGKQWQVPAVYLFEEGLVVDLCKRIEPRELTEFYEKWGSRDEEKLTEEEQKLLCRESPFYQNFRLRAHADQRELPVRMGCGCAYCPPKLRPQDAAVSGDPDLAERQLMEAYGLEPEAGWTFWRNSFAWPDRRPESVRSVVLTLRKDPEDLPGPHFWTVPGETGKKVNFRHPVTGKAYTLTVLGQEPKILPLGELPGELEIDHMPDHFTVMRYRVEPELSREEILIGDCALSDQPVRTGEGPAASSVSIIGGADGPTSVFLAGKSRTSGSAPAVREVYSALHYKPADRVEWKLTFRVDEDRETNVHIQLSGE